MYRALFLLLLSANAFAHPESYYQEKYCWGEMEFVLPDKARVDCLTENFAMEYDFAKKWAESIGQALYYSRVTGKQPAVTLIVEKGKDQRYLKRFIEATKGLNITLFLVYKDE
jgi:hypothetical protein